MTSQPSSSNPAEASVFRATAMGAALEESLAALEASGMGLTADQLRAVWVAFDDSMSDALQSVPPSYVCKVTVKDDPAAAAAGLPAYRCIDGRWTIAAGPAKVELHAVKAAESFDADFLLVDVRDDKKKK